MDITYLQKYIDGKIGVMWPLSPKLQWPSDHGVSRQLNVTVLKCHKLEMEFSTRVPTPTNEFVKSIMSNICLAMMVHKQFQYRLAMNMNKYRIEIIIILLPSEWLNLKGCQQCIDLSQTHQTLKKKI